MNPPRFIAPLSIVFLLCHCASTTSVKNHVPRPPEDVPAEVAEENRRTMALAKRDPAGSLGFALSSARAMENRIMAGDRSPATFNAYNYAVARAVDAIDKAGLDPWAAPVLVPGTGGAWRLRASLARPEPRLTPSNYRMISVDAFNVGGTYFKTLEKKDGVGAPVAVVVKHPDKSLKHTLSETTMYGTATVTISFQGDRADLVLHESLREDEVTLKGRTFPLAADYSTPLALLLDHQKVEKLGLVRLLDPERYADTARLTRLQLYDPERVPVLLVHGLDSTPATWTPMLNELRADPVIRKRCQFWVFSYPSGYPYPYSATLLRRQLDAIGRQFPGHKPVVMLGHSMGGDIARLMLTDSGDTLWRAYFGKPPEETVIPGKFRGQLEETLVFRHRQDISRTIFISTPHRGSEIAINSFGRLFSRLVRVPRLLADTRDALVNVITLDATALTLDRAPSSIDTLAPNNRFVKAIGKIPIAREEKYHSIIGDRGKGDTPHSSDGVVPYWSSHLDGALSEKIVPSGHSAHQNPQAIAEVRRILLLHLRDAP
ncbi:alpha/beta fold hydrolase [Luteolibacter yonseiensis]|uniref:Alpha/beta fold hydrolase n=1 Tax=Luteolibacter yonseiensis TaxID=1144680 RepID=A0A934QZG5_9BACT|nr:alpha/beta fold hydrolase [Luteolibacter yonseiensis]MBK1814076.1 alpha/beta fold hydrolase [Luteolibacter yonseiensis]